MLRTERLGTERAITATTRKGLCSFHYMYVSLFCNSYEIQNALFVRIIADQF